MGEDLAPLPEYKAATTTTLDFDGLLTSPLRLHEDLKTGCGGQLWPAGMVLAKQMLRYHRDKLGKARMWVVCLFSPNHPLLRAMDEVSRIAVDGQLSHRHNGKSSCRYLVASNE